MGKRFLVLLLLVMTLAMPSAPARAASGTIVLLVLDNNSLLTAKALAGLSLPDAIQVEYLTASDLQRDPAGAAKLLGEARVIVVDVMGRELEEFLLSRVDRAGKTIYAVRTSTDDARLKKQGFLFDASIAGYYQSLSVANLRNLLALVARRHFGADLPVAPPVAAPALGLYHPEAAAPFTRVESYLAWYRKRPGFASGQPWLGVLFYGAYLSPGQQQAMATAIRRLEAAGFNVLPCFGRDRAIIETFLRDREGRSRVDIVLAYTLKFSSILSQELHQSLAALGVPVLNAVSLYRDTVDQWRHNPAGLSGRAVSWAMATPEAAGVVEPTVLTAKQELHEQGTGRRFFVSQTVSENLDHLIPRLKRWVALQRKPNREKRLAIMFYNHHPGKQNIGASYLNVFRSLETILAALKRAGYRTGQAALSEARIKEMILAGGRNIGSWAPGELERLLADGQVARVSLGQYRQWFAELPPAFRQGVINQWGEVDKAGIMTWKGSFIVPAVTSGNLVLLPEPSRGWGDDPWKLYHDTSLYPHHQYLAVYLWLEKVFKADAVIHLGTHATYEWTPGKQAGLSPACAPEVLIGQLPNLYPYVVDDVGEAIQAKRRGRGVMLSHLTPMLVQGGLSKEYRRMAALVNEYSRARARASEVADEKYRQILALAKATGIMKDLGLDPARERPEKLVEKLGEYLDEIKHNLMPYGLHTYGRSPGTKEAVEMAAAIGEANPGIDRNKVVLAIQESGAAEIRNLLTGLNGRFVPPGQGNDPIRNPAALPTGRNLYGLNPANLPSPAAWRLGKRAAERIIADYQRHHGRYPTKIAVVLWATETLRNEGVNEATILWLLGVRPTWSPSGRLVGMQPVPGSLLGRPRIDVLVNASGLYRDLFPDKIVFLDRAVRLAARQTDVENLIALNDQRIARQLIQEGTAKEEAHRLARLRIFSEPPGSYGTGVAEMAANSGIWQESGEIAGVFANRVGFAYGTTGWGTPAQTLLRKNLAGVEVALHSRSSNLYGLLDNDDMFQYLGGLALAVARETGKPPETMVTNQTRAGQVKVEGVAKSLGREMRSRYLNPKWIRGMMGEGYGGAREMAKFVEYLWGWQVTTPFAVDQTAWQQAYQVYVEDKYQLGIQEFFNRASPWAFQSLAGRMLEAIRKGAWQPGDQVKQKLAREYVADVLAHGIACCDHTCNNPLLHQMVMNIVSLPGLMQPQQVEEFKALLARMAGKTLANQVKDRLTLQQQVTAAPGRQQSARIKANSGSNKQATSSARPSEQVVEGFRMEKIERRDQASKLASSGVEWLATLALLLLVALMGRAVARGGKKR